MIRFRFSNKLKVPPLFFFKQKRQICRSWNYLPVPFCPHHLAWKKDFGPEFETVSDTPSSCRPALEMLSEFWRGGLLAHDGWNRCRSVLISLPSRTWWAKDKWFHGFVLWNICGARNGYWFGGNGPSRAFLVPRFWCRSKLNAVFSFWTLQWFPIRRFWNIWRRRTGGEATGRRCCSGLCRGSGGPTVALGARSLLSFNELLQIVSYIFLAEPDGFVQRCVSPSVIKTTRMETWNLVCDFCLSQRTISTTTKKNHHCAKTACQTEFLNLLSSLFDRSMHSLPKRMAMLVCASICKGSNVLWLGQHKRSREGNFKCINQH